MVGHLAVCITVRVLAVVCPIAFNTFIVFLFLFIKKRWLETCETCCGLSASK